MDTLPADIRERLDQFMKDLKKRYPNGIKPGKLRQGCISAVFFDESGNEREGTEEEWDKLFDDAAKESLLRKQFAGRK